MLVTKLSVRLGTRIAVALTVPWIIFSAYSAGIAATVAAVSPPFVAAEAPRELTLEQVLLDEPPLPGLRVLGTASVPPEEIISGQGAFYDDLRDQGIAEAVQRSFGTAEETGEFLIIRLVYWASERASRGVASPDQGSVGRRVGRMGTGEAWIVPQQGGSAVGLFHDGAVGVEVWMAPLDKISEGDRDAALTAVMRAQDRALPVGQDLTERTTISIQRSHWLGFATTTGFVFFLLSLAQALRWALRPPRVRVGKPERPDGPVTVLDVSEQSRGLRKSAFRGWLVRSAVLCLGVGLLYQYLPGGVLVMGLAISALLLVWQSVSDRIAAGRSSIPRPRSSFLVAGGQAVSGATTLTGLVLLSTAFNADELGGPQEVTDTTRSALALLFMSGVGLLLGGLLIQRLVLRLAMPSVANALAHDERRSVLLLRSFKDDNLRMAVTHSSLMSTLERLNGVRSTFERVVVWVLWQIGPVVAIGRPGTSLAPLGAAREYHADDNWQSAVTNHMREASWVVFVVGDTQAWGWEVQEAAHLGLLDKCLFLVPPVRSEQSASRLAHLESSLRVQILAHLDSTAGSLLVVVPTNGTPSLIVADVADDCSYRVALLTATASISEHNHAIDQP